METQCSISFTNNVFENVVDKTSAILFRSQYDNEYLQE